MIGRSQLGKWGLFLGRCLGLAAMLGACCPQIVLGDADVDDCTQDALEQALTKGGVVRFTNDCSLVLSRTIFITAPVTLSAGGRQVILSAGTNFGLVNVSPGVTFTAERIHFRGGSAAQGGGILINNDAVVTLNNCSFTNNLATDANGESGDDGADGYNNGGDGANGADGKPASGGAVYNLGTLVCSNVIFSGNKAAGGAGGDGGNGGTGRFNGGDGGNGGKGAPAAGGAIQNFGAVTLINCSFYANSAAGGNGGARGDGGDGAYDGLPGTGGLGAPGYGGAICSSNYLDIQGCTFSGNTVAGGSSGDSGTESNGNGLGGKNGAEAAGGALLNAFNLAITNSTFSTNTATGGTGGDGGPAKYTAGNGGNGGDAIGGTLANAGTAILMNCTLAGGAAIGGSNGVAGSGTFAGKNGKPGKALGGNVSSLSGTLWLKNTILGLTPGGGSGYGTLSDGGNNISADGSVSLGASRINTDPKLGVLTNNGGLTLTFMPQPGSPAANAASTTSIPPKDQRGVARPGAGTTLPDVGAVEGIGPAITSQPLNQSRTNKQAVSFSVVVTGDLPLVYKWRFNETNAVVSGTNSTLVITNIADQHYGVYQVVISNAFAAVTSSVATLEFGAMTPTRARVVTPVITNDQITFSWLSQTAQRYRIQYKNTLKDTNWVHVANMYGTGSWLTNTQPITNVPSRFYRLVSP